MSKMPRRILLLMLGLTMFGCGQSAPDKKGGSSTPTPGVTGDAGKPGGSGIAQSSTGTTAASNTDSKASSASAAEVSTFLGDDVVGLAVIHPRRLSEWPLFKLAEETGVVENLVYDRSMLELLGLQPKEIERLTVVIDQSEVDKGVAASGLDEEPKKVPGGQARNQLKQVGLAFHNYHEVYSAFPRHDGSGDGRKVGLSWRVHLLPFVDEAVLYNEFKLDEPWDSEHNKSLIEKMPAVFNSPGVTDAGKTAIHVFTGHGTPFDGDKGKSLRDFTDGSSNTILAVVAGADTAETWTKPGGLAFDLKAPSKSLGTIPDPTFMALLADGSVRSISTMVDPTTLANLIQIGDGNPIAEFDADADVLLAGHGKDFEQYRNLKQLLDDIRTARAGTNDFEPIKARAKKLSEEYLPALRKEASNEYPAKQALFWAIRDELPLLMRGDLTKESRAEKNFELRLMDAAKMIAGSHDSEPDRPVPTVIAQLVKPADRKAIIEKLIPPVTEAHRAEMKKFGVTLPSPTEESYEGQTLTHDGHSAIWFPNDTTFVLGSIDGVKKAIATKKSGKPGAQKLVSQLDDGADLAVVIDTASQAKLVQKALENAPPVPGIGLAPHVHLVTLKINLTGKTKGNLLALAATLADDAAATMLIDLAQGFLDLGKQSLDEIPVPPVLSDDEKAAVKMVLDTAKSATLKKEGSKVEFLVSVPAGLDNLPKLLKPALEKAQAVAQARKRMNNLKQMALAFHNYHDVNRSFPGAGHAAQSKTALSWRVHLLPYLDAAPLYNEFKMDEPWDSEHNKKLIAKMPEIFKTEGVKDPVKTALHVFTGPGAPFADDKAPGLFSITDGSSNTILAVEAGPDTAEIWTKPEGLDFDPKNPIKALGQLKEEIFRVVMCDGSARSIPKTINPDTLRKLIQSADGEPVEF